MNLFYQKFLSSTVIPTILATYRGHANPNRIRSGGVGYG
jgi:hypothetical protein